MDNLTSIIIAIIGSGALSTIISAIINSLKDDKKKDSGVQAGTRMLLYDRIKHLGKAYIERGSVSSEELEDIIAMHKVYHDDLKGNGFLDSLMAQVKKLPIQ